MSLIIEVESKPAVIIKPRLSLVVHTDHVSCYFLLKTSTELLANQMFCQHTVYTVPQTMSFI